MRRKTQSIFKTFGTLACLALPMSVYAGQAQPAGDYTWSGGSSENANVSTPENWVGGEAPAGVGDNLFFEGGNLDDYTNILFDVDGQRFTNLTFNAGAGLLALRGADGVTIELSDGAVITTLSNNIINGSEYEQGVLVPLQLLGDLTLDLQNNCLIGMGGWTADSESTVTKLGEHGIQLLGDFSQFTGTFDVQEGWMGFEPYDGSADADAFGGSIIMHEDTTLYGVGTMSGNLTMLTGSELFIGDAYADSDNHVMTVNGDVNVATDTTTFFTIKVAEDQSTTNDQLVVEGDVWIETGHKVRYDIDNLGRLTADSDAEGGPITQTFRVITCNGDNGILVSNWDESESFPEFDVIVELVNAALVDAELVYTQGATEADPDTVDLIVKDVYTMAEFIQGRNLNASLAAYMDSFLQAGYAQTPTDAGLKRLFNALQYYSAQQMTGLMTELSNSVQSAAVAENVAVHLNRTFADNLNGHIGQRRANLPRVSMLNGLTDQPHMLAQNQEDKPEDVVGKQVQDITMQGNWGVFAKAYGLFANQDSGSQVNGYSADTVGVQFGLDNQINDHWLVGLAVDYAMTDVTMDNSAGEMQINTIRVGPFVSYAKDAWIINASLTYGNHTIDSNIDTGYWGLTNDSYEANDMTMFIGGEYRYELNDVWALTPSASLQYTYYNRAGYSQSASGFDIDSQDINTLHSRLGVKLDGQIKAMNMTLLPEVSLGWEHEFMQDDDPVDAYSGGNFAFSSKTITPDQNSVYFGAGVTALVKDNCSVFVNYEGNIGSDSDTHGISGGIRFTF
ncbi:MAG: autotransporter outer membrane beta-barrel domain-containing protein [Phycisphaeraceae bacterium JB051]